MKRFEDLEFKQHPATISEEVKKDLIIQKGVNKDSDMFKEMLQAKITFDNGYFLSVIFGVAFYSNGTTTYEAYCAEYSDEPLGHLTKQEITDYMYEIQSLKSKDKQ